MKKPSLSEEVFIPFSVHHLNPCMHYISPLDGLPFLKDSVLHKITCIRFHTVLLKDGLEGEATVVQEKHALVTRTFNTHHFCVFTSLDLK